MKKIKKFLQFIVDIFVTATPIGKIALVFCCVIAPISTWFVSEFWQAIIWIIQLILFITINYLGFKGKLFKK